MKAHQTQTSQINLWAVIPAAGSGQRFSKTELKQYQYIANKTVLEHSVERLNQLNLVGYVLAVSEHDHQAKNLNFVHKEKAHFCIGGKERVDSVLNALKYLQSIASNDDYVLVHDAARPCVALESLCELVQYCQKNQTNAILATPVRDTLKHVVANGHIEKTVSREGLWQAQTPQMAKLGQLVDAIELALTSNISITDEASALEYAGMKVDVVQGRSDNIKITYTEDLALAELILASQKSSVLSHHIVRQKQQQQQQQ